jgi:hypothetical protein
LIKIPSLRRKDEMIMRFSKASDDPSKDIPIILQTKYRGGSNGKHDPFYISLEVNELLLHNCMLDYGASKNVIPLKFVERLGLTRTNRI